MKRIRKVTVDEIISGAVRKNEIVAYVYEQLIGVELYTDTHGYYYWTDGQRKHVSYKEMKDRLKGTYIRVSETEFEEI